ncbi:hypothetical protein GCM10028790_16770 [Micromonospora taraxaci]
MGIETSTDRRKHGPVLLISQVLFAILHAPRLREPERATGPKPVNVGGRGTSDLRKDLLGDEDPNAGKRFGHPLDP